MRKPDYDWNAYFHGNPLQKWWKRKIATIVMEMVGTANPVLEVGAGSSPLLSMLPVKEKVGLDIDLAKVKFMQKKDLSSKYYCEKGEDTGFPDGSCSVVMCLEVLEHHPRPYHLVRELARVTMVGGKVIIATPNFASMKWNVLELVYGLMSRSGYHEEHDSRFTESAVIALADSVGSVSYTHLTLPTILLV